MADNQDSFGNKLPTVSEWFDAAALQRQAAPGASCVDQHHKYVSRCPYCHTRLPGPSAPAEGVVDPFNFEVQLAERLKDPEWLAKWNTGEDLKSFNEMLQALRSEEGDSVTLLADNADFGGPANAIECCGAWTDWRDWRFTGDTLMGALLAAYQAKLAPEAAQALQRQALFEQDAQAVFEQASAAPVSREVVEALRPFANLGAALPEHYPQDSRFHGPGRPRFWYEIDPAHIWAARDALSAIQPAPGVEEEGDLSAVDESAASVAAQPDCSAAPHSDGKDVEVLLTRLKRHHGVAHRAALSHSPESLEATLSDAATLIAAQAARLRDLNRELAALKATVWPESEGSHP